MTTLAVKIPDAVLLQSSLSLEALSHHAQSTLAMQFFRSGFLTSGQAAEMADMNRVEFLFAAGRAQIPVAELDGAELAEEIQTAVRL